MKKFIISVLFLIFPVTTFAGFPEGESGYDLEKLEKSFRLPCDEIGNDECLHVHLVWELVLGYLE